MKQSGARSPSIDVLQHVDEEEVLLAERVDRRVEREHDERDPGPEARLRQPATGLAAGGERLRAAEVEHRDDHRRHDLQRIERPRAKERRRVHALGRIGACTSSTTTSSPRSCATSRPATSGKLGFDLVARYGRVGDDHVAVEAGTSLGAARPRRVQAAALASSSGARSTSSSSPGTGGCRASTTWASRSTRTSSRRCSARAAQWNLRVQEHGGRRTFVATNAGYRIEVHPPRDWIDDLLAEPGGAPSGGAAAAGRRAGREGRARSPTSSASS